MDAHNKLRGLALFCLMMVPPALAQQAAPGQSEALERLQEDERQRFQRELDDSYLPGRRRQAPGKTSDIESDDQRCFEIRHIVLESVDRPAPRLQALLRPHLERREGRCMTLQDIRVLQRDLGNHLIDAGYIASRVLLPRQSLNDHRLRLTLVPGRIENLETDELERGLLELALPLRTGDVLTLPGMEQAVENLNRIQGLDASLDIKPGQEEGRSTVVAEARHERRYAPSMVLTQQRYGAIHHTTGNLNVEIGSPLGLTDRLVIKTNTDLDTALSDEAWGAGLDYDLGVGYWLWSAGFNRQAYSNTIRGTFRTFEASGTTDVSRIEATRVLFRSGVTRLTAGLLARYTDARNLLAGAPIRVSTYRLKTGGVRLDYSQRLGGWRLGSVLTWEGGSAGGPATNLPDGVRVANPTHERTKLYLSALRPFSWLNGSARWWINSQYSRDRLFPSARFSLTGGVPGYEELSFSGDSGATTALEVSANQQVGPFSVRPNLRWSAGVIPDNGREPEFVKLSAATLGVALARTGFSATLEQTWPVERYSTHEANNEYVSRLALQWKY